jgi:hypothetical protein
MRVPRVTSRLTRRAAATSLALGAALSAAAVGSRPGTPDSVAGAAVGGPEPGRGQGIASLRAEQGRQQPVGGPHPGRVRRQQDEGVVQRGVRAPEEPYVPHPVVGFG